MKKRPKTDVTDTALPGDDTPAYYHEILKTDPLNQQAYTRLMILYRKLKDYKKELRIIESAIKAFESLYNRGNKTGGAMVNKLSRQLNLAFGLTDQKGKKLYDQEPVSTWKKRKAVVLNKLKKI